MPSLYQINPLQVNHLTHLILQPQQILLDNDEHTEYSISYSDSVFIYLLSAMTSPHAKRFLEPTNPAQKRYEALRAYHVDGLSSAEVAIRFGYSHGTVRNICSEFANSDDPDFFLPKPRKRKATRKEDESLKRKERIVELRKSGRLSIYDIINVLKKEGVSVSSAYVHGVLKGAGVQKLARRSLDERLDIVRAHKAATSDRRVLNLGSRTFRTEFAGLFLFAHDLGRADIDGIVERSGMPGSGMIPAGCAFRSLLALKLWGIGRPSRIMAETLDEGLGLFCGLNVIPKRSTLTEYSCRIDPRMNPGLMDRWYKVVRGLGVNLGGEESFDLDFHAIPYHGDAALVERHYVSKRSRRQKGILAFVARDADARMFAWANTDIRKKGASDEILRFIEGWEERTGRKPRELVFDGGFTTYANLGRLEEMGIRFLTLRRRSENMVSVLASKPSSEWKKIRLSNVGREYRTPKIYEQRVKLRDYPGDIRQIAIKDLGRRKPVLLLTNQMEENAAKLIDRYARRMIIENTIADAIDFFHMDALSAAVAMKVNVDAQLTVMASGLYRVLGNFQADTLDSLIFAGYIYWRADRITSFFIRQHRMVQRSGDRP